MIEQITDALAVHLAANVPALSKSGGIAQVVQVQSDTATRRLPGCILAGQSNYTAMLPDSLESAVSFFQVVSTSQRDEAPGGRVDVETTIRLVLWVNNTRVYPANADAVLQDVLFYVRGFRFDETPAGSPKGVRVRLSAYEPKSKEIFNAYTFDEIQTQFLTPPYDWRQVQIRVLYSITAQCSPAFAANSPHC